MTEWMGLPALAAANGAQIDGLIGWTHIFMLILFVGWGGFFVYCLVRYRRSRQPVANYTGVRSHYSNYAEVAVAVVEAVLLVGFSIPLWAARVDHRPSESESLLVEVTGEQFAWNVHYAGPDGKFGRTDIKLLDLQSNPLGLDRDDPAAKDDVTTLNQLYLPVNKPIIVRLRSKDVIHSFGVPEFRVKQDAVPRSDDSYLVHPERHDCRDADADREYGVPVPDRVRTALRFRSRQDARIRHRPDCRRVPKVDGREGQGAERTGPVPLMLLASHRQAHEGPPLASEIHGKGAEPWESGLQWCSPSRFVSRCGFRFHHPTTSRKGARTHLVHMVEAARSL